MTPDEVTALVQRETSNLVRQVRVLEQTLGIYRQAGLDRLQTTPLITLPQEYEEAAPTDDAEDGTVRVVNISGTTYLYARTDGAWERVALS